MQNTIFVPSSLISRLSEICKPNATLYLWIKLPNELSYIQSITVEPFISDHHTVVTDGNVVTLRWTLIDAPEPNEMIFVTNEDYTREAAENHAAKILKELQQKYGCDDIEYYVYVEKAL